MVDLVGTCPKDFWREWIAEGDAAGDSPTGTEWSWYTRSSLVPKIRVGDRFYVVAHGRLRGFAVVTRVQWDPLRRAGCICRRAGAIACTLDEPVPGFRGLRERWWLRGAERPFPDWRTP